MESPLAMVEDGIVAREDDISSARLCGYDGTPEIRRISAKLVEQF